MQGGFSAGWVSGWANRVREESRVFSVVSVLPLDLRANGLHRSAL